MGDLNESIRKLPDRTYQNAIDNFEVYNNIREQLNT